MAKSFERFRHFVAPVVERRVRVRGHSLEVVHDRTVRKQACPNDRRAWNFLLCEAVDEGLDHGLRQGAVGTCLADDTHAFDQADQQAGVAITAGDVWRRWADEVSAVTVSCGHLVPEHAATEVLGTVLPFFAAATVRDLDVLAARPESR